MEAIHKLWEDISYDARRSSDPLLDGDHYSILETKHTYVIIDQQENVWETPREWDNFGHMICFHRRYDLGDEHTEQYQKDPDDFSEWLSKEIRNKCVVYLPLYLYDHSGITMHYASVYPYNDRWDAGTVGYIYVTLDDIRREYRIKRVTKQYRLKALELLKGEVDIYDQYLRGDVYCFSQICKYCGEQLDSCSSFYGDDWEKNGLLDQAMTDRKCQSCVDEVEKLYMETMEVQYG